MSEQVVTSAGASGSTVPGPPIVVAESRRRWRPHAGAVAVLLIGAVITTTFAIAAQNFRDDNEDRLLRERVKEGAAVVGAAIPASQTQLRAAAVVTETVSGRPQAFRRLIRPAMAAGTFVSVSIWDVTEPEPLLLDRVGAAPKLAEQPARLQEVLTGAVGKEEVSIVDLLDGRPRRLGYASAATGPEARFVAYAEQTLPRSRRASIDDDAAFADLDYALYLGRERAPDTLLASSVGGDVRLEGRVESQAVPFGDRQLLLVFRPRSDLGGTALARLPAFLAVLGAVLTLAAAALAEWLIRRREHAEHLAAELEKIAAENLRLLADQRTVAYTLQHSLLPERLPDVSGLELGVRYVAGVEGVDIGGDWYDVMPLDDGRLFFVVGDVSGRGLRAATVMASLRYAIRAYAAQGDDPATILTKTSKLISVARDGSFATVLCGNIDVGGHLATLASAGHPYPLLMANGQTRFVATHNGVPVGVAHSTPYETVTASIPAHATLLVFTDGLVERRGEQLDVGFERLRDATVNAGGTLEDLLTKVVAEVTDETSEDDTAVLGIRWRT